MRIANTFRCNRTCIEKVNNRTYTDNLVELGVADEVIQEPQGGAHQDWDGAALALKEALLRNLAELSGLGTEELLRRRQAKYEGMGMWREASAAHVAGEVSAGA